MSNIYNKYVLNNLWRGGGYAIYDCLVNYKFKEKWGELKCLLN